MSEENNRKQLRLNKDGVRKTRELGEMQRRWMQVGEKNLLRMHVKQLR